jgi:hypothetical protein
MASKQEMLAFLQERRTSRSCALQRILSAPSTSLLCRLKLRHHDRIAGTETHISVEEVRPTKYPEEEVATLKVVELRAERRQERKVGTARLVARLRHAEVAIVNTGHLWEALRDLSDAGGDGWERAREGREGGDPRPAASSTFCLVLMLPGLLARWGAAHLLTVTCSRRLKYLTDY